MRRATKRRVVGGLAVTGAAAVAAYALLRRPVIRHWGATKPEVRGTMAGDDRVRHPNYVSTRAVTIDAPVADVWPWLVQMGYQRGGLYSYDWLDRAFGYLDRPSAESVMPEYQSLAVGDTIPLGRGPAWPVVELEPERTLVLEPMAGVVTWAFSLTPIDQTTTRLVTRVRFQVPKKAKDRLIMKAMDPAAFFMTRKMLLGIKRRAEALAQR